MFVEMYATMPGITFFATAYVHLHVQGLTRLCGDILRFSACGRWLSIGGFASALDLTPKIQVRPFDTYDHSSLR